MNNGDGKSPIAPWMVDVGGCLIVAGEGTVATLAQVELTDGRTLTVCCTVDPEIAARLSALLDDQCAGTDAVIV